jgi:hypothetical protein
MKLKRAVWGIGSLMALAAIATAAPADMAKAADVKAGVLSCDVASGWGFIFGSSKDLKCTYSNSGATEHYTGSITKFGVDIGYSGAAVIVWTVLAPTSQTAKGALAGTYVGATGSAAVGGGVGANVLVGGSNKTISLQPVSFSGGTGLNVAGGVAGLTLEAAP